MLPLRSVVNVGGHNPEILALVKDAVELVSIPLPSCKSPYELVLTPICRRTRLYSALLVVAPALVAGAEIMKSTVTFSWMTAGTRRQPSRSPPQCDVGAAAVRAARHLTECW